MGDIDATINELFTKRVNNNGVKRGQIQNDAEDGAAIGKIPAEQAVYEYKPRTFDSRQIFIDYMENRGALKEEILIAAVKICQNGLFATQKHIAWQDEKNVKDLICTIKADPAKPIYAGELNDWMKKSGVTQHHIGRDFAANILRICKTKGLSFKSVFTPVSKMLLAAGVDLGLENETSSCCLYPGQQTIMTRHDPLLFYTLCVGIMMYGTYLVHLEINEPNKVLPGDWKLFQKLYIWATKGAVSVQYMDKGTQETLPLLFQATETALPKFFNEKFLKVACYRADIQLSKRWHKLHEEEIGAMEKGDEKKAHKVKYEEHKAAFASIKREQKQGPLINKFLLEKFVKFPNRTEDNAGRDKLMYMIEKTYKDLEKNVRHKVAPKKAAVAVSMRISSDPIKIGGKGMDHVEYFHIDKIELEAPIIDAKKNLWKYVSIKHGESTLLGSESTIGKGLKIDKTDGTMYVLVEPKT